MDILNTFEKFVHILNLLRCFPEHIFYYLCEENDMISEFFGFILIGIVLSRFKTSFLLYKKK